jgi:hypothetical protein
MSHLKFPFLSTPFFLVQERWCNHLSYVSFVTSCEHNHHAGDEKPTTLGNNGLPSLKVDKPEIIAKVSTGGIRFH